MEYELVLPSVGSSACSPGQVANGERAKSAIGSDPRVREAFDLAIDRAVINQVVYNGEFTPTAQFLNRPIQPGVINYILYPYFENAIENLNGIGYNLGTGWQRS